VPLHGKSAPFSSRGALILKSSSVVNGLSLERRGGGDCICMWPLTEAAKSAAKKIAAFENIV
jgi:hypothetical protein